MTTASVTNHPSPAGTLHGIDALLVRAGTALAGLGERSAARRLAARRSAGPNLLQLQAQCRHAEDRATLTALGHSLLLR